MVAWTNVREELERGSCKLVRHSIDGRGTREGRDQIPKTQGMDTLSETEKTKQVQNEE